MQEKLVLTIKETVERSRQEGMPLSEYTLRRALRTGSIPCRKIGQKYLIAWKNVERWLMCEDGGDEMFVEPPKHIGEIRKINV